MSTLALEHASAIVSPNEKSVFSAVDLLPRIHIIAERSRERFRRHLSQ